ncbi:MAG: transposase [Candidatus Hydrogenedentes bacterium]|nr:transposase [Candidatus Hydrogenedentota bacterium]
MADHVHILAKLRQDISLSDVLRDTKSNSSGWVHDTFPGYEEFAWQRGYGAFTVSASHINVVERYILNQEEHHKEMTFQEEFIGLLEKHSVEYNERYLWD